MNCRGLADTKKRRDVMHFIRSKRFSIVFLQDTHLTDKSTVYFENLWHGKSYHSCYSSRSRGTSILINNNCPCTVVEERKSDCGNFILLSCKIYNESYLLINIYGPNEDNPEFYKRLINIIEQFDVDHIIIAGDFNFVMSRNDDSLNYFSEGNVRARQTFKELAQQNRLIDIWRHKHPNERKYTWRRHNPLKSGRLDMFFISEEMENYVINADFIPGYRTDHNAVTLTIQGKQKRGNGLWKLNTSHLSSDDYKERIKTCIIQTIQQYAAPVYEENVYKDYKNYSSIQLVISDCLFYETLIMMIRGETIKFSKQKARQKRTAEARLETDIVKAEEKLTESSQQEDLEELERLKKELEELRKPMIDGLIVRSRVAWHEQGERSTKYFLTLEKKNYQKKNIQFIEDGNHIVTSNEKILETFSSIFKSKYSASKDIAPNKSFVNRNVSYKLNEIEQTDLEADVSLSELTAALNSMKKGKTPGSNGFTVEFFRCFWLEIGPFLCRATQESLNEDGRLPSHREGIITLIPKKGKPLNTPKSWRPITLLNTDYKIISTVIANRLKKIMTKIISPVQTAYTAGRYIGENTRLVYDIIHWANTNRQSGIILAADFESAFESVDWNYLRLVFDQLNFGQKLKKIINHLYLNDQNNSRIILNGHLGKQIHLQRGIRQGDPASGYLFNIAVSILTKQILNSPKVIGLQINQREQIKISQYADDTILFLNGTKESLEGSIEELTVFGNHSGLKINLEKTSCMPIGITKTDHIDTLFNINFVNSLTILGIHIERDLTSISDKNIQLKIPKIKSELSQWKRRYLTPIGRICIVKTMLISKLVHLFMSLPNPSLQCQKEIERLFYSFIWGSKNDKVKRTKLIQDLQRDGLNMVDVDSFIRSMKLTWLHRLLKSEADWMVLAERELPDVRQLLTYSDKKLSLVQRKTSNIFYKDILDALIHYNKCYQPSDEEILTETIWFSNWTKYNTTIIKSWDNCGLRFIGDLFNKENGEFLTKEEIEHVYGIKMTFLCHATLLRSIPEQLQVRINKGDLQNPNIPYKIMQVLNINKFSKHAYNAFKKHRLTENSKSEEHLRTKWTQDIGEFSEGSLQKVNNATLSTTLIYLHFRIINRIFATNKYLYNINILQHDTCSFCEDSTETIVHLFWQCSFTQIFIKEILSRLKRVYNISISMERAPWFNLDNLTNMEIVVVTLSKSCIHNARINLQKPSPETFFKRLQLEITKEYIIAQRRNKLSAFEQKWGDLRKLLKE